MTSKDVTANMIENLTSDPKLSTLIKNIVQGVERSSTPTRKCWEQSLFSLERRKFGGDLIIVRKYWKGRCKEDIAALLVLPSDRTRGNEHKLKHRSF